MSDETLSPAPDAAPESPEAPAEQTTTYMEGKYESISALEDGYKNLQSTFSKKTQEYSEAMGGRIGAPEAYELGEGLEASESLQNYARENQFSNDALNGLVEFYQGEVATQNEAFAAQQREALGADADARLNNVQDWAKANLGADAMDTLGNMITSAKSVEMFEQIMKMNSGTAPAQVAKPKTMVDGDTIKSMRFAKDENGRRKMSSDRAYRTKVEAMEAEFIGGGGKL